MSEAAALSGKMSTESDHWIFTKVVRDPDQSAFGGLVKAKG